MLKALLAGAVAGGALIVAIAAAPAAGPYTFALVPKNTNNPFFDQALAGCKKAEAELKGAVKCLYIGPGEHGGGGAAAASGARPPPPKGVCHATRPPRPAPRQGPGPRLGLGPAAQGQGRASRLCRHPQLRHRREHREARH